MPAAVNRNRIRTYACGPCGARVASALNEQTGKRLTIERVPMGAGDLALVLELPGFERRDDLPRVVPTRGGTSIREHVHTTEARSFSAANFRRKQRDQ